MNHKALKKIAGILMPVLLVVYSLILINQGLTVTDTGYNYGNYVNFASLDGMWKFSTYLATAIGAFFTKLPLGNTVLGLNFYTGLVKAATALVVYYFCVTRFEMKGWLVFLAELMALGYCWCPTALLYNYCTYFLFTLGGILLCLAVKENKGRLYICAGICLGINVLVRLPNLAEMSLICALWLIGFIKKDRFCDTVKRTLLCILGYVTGMGGVLIYIFCKYGVSNYFTGIQQILAMPKEAGGYSLREMLYGDFLMYLQNLKWLWMTLSAVIIGTVLYAVKRQRFLVWKRILYVTANVLLIFIFYKMNMFKFVYYNYDGVYTVGTFFLIISGVLGLYILFFGGKEYELRMQAMVVGIIILVTPLGSNNYLFTAVNNLFFVTPFVFRICHKWFADRSNAVDKRGYISPEPLKITLLSMIIFTFVQGVLFGATFVFRDGISGEKQSAQVENNSVLKGMYTTEKNAERLESLNGFLTENKMKGSEVILYKDVPALAFYMELEPSLSTTWPDLASFSTSKFERELQELEEEVAAGVKRPMVILGCEPDFEEPKINLLKDYMDRFEYKLVFSNDAFYVYF